MAFSHTMRESWANVLTIAPARIHELLRISLRGIFLCY